MGAELVGAAVGDQRRAGDQTPIARRQLRPGQDVAEQDVVGELDQLRREVTDELLRGEGSLPGALFWSSVMIAFR